MYALNNLKTGVKLIGGFLIVALLVVVVAVLGYVNMDNLNNSLIDMYTNNVISMQNIGHAEVDFQTIRGDLDKYILIPAERATIEQDINNLISEMNTHMAAYRQTDLVREEVDNLAGFDTAWETYQHEVAKNITLAKTGQEITATGNLSIGGDTSNARQDVGGHLDSLFAIQEKRANETHLVGDQTFTQATTLMIVAGLIGLLLALGMGILLSRSITSPLSQGVGMMQELVLGHLSGRLKMGRKDEIGVLADAMDTFAADLQTNVVGTIKKIAEGDLSANLTAKDSLDEITPALNTTIGALQGLTSEATMLTRAAVEGRLSTRGNSDKFKGGYQAIVQGVNDTLDAVIGPLNMAADFVDRTARGDIPQPITDTYNGDFNTIKNNLNNMSANLQGLIAEATLLSKAAVEGRLSTRGNSDKFKGGYQAIVQGVNDTLDAVIGPLNVAADFVDRIARGEIPQPISDTYNGDFNILKNNLNSLSTNLRKFAVQSREAAANTTAATAEILAAVSQHTASAAEQSASIQETSTTVDEVRAAAEQTAQKASDVAKESQSAVVVSKTGSQSVAAILTGMQDIRDKVQAIAQDILMLSEQTQQIGEITSTVNDIADQSNLLALNATIEASKAGEQGKGFTVVAGEVRNLAAQSKQATTKVRIILGDIQKATNAAVLATEQGTRGVEAGMLLAQQAGGVIDQLAETIREAAQASQVIAASAHQQNIGMEQIALAMKDINQATVQFVAGARQSQSAAESLNVMAQELQKTVEFYKD